MRIIIAGVERGWNPERTPGYGDIVENLRFDGYSVIDQRLTDKQNLWDDEGLISTAYRNHALINDITYLGSCTSLALIEGWESYPEAVAMYHAAIAMKKEIVMVTGATA